MRDILIVIFTSGASFFALKRPWWGVLALAIFNYLNPHRYAWGFATTLPVYFIVFLATLAGMVLHPEERQPFRWTRETIFFVLLHFLLHMF